MRHCIWPKVWNFLSAYTMPQWNILHLTSWDGCRQNASALKCLRSSLGMYIRYIYIYMKQKLISCLVLGPIHKISQYAMQIFQNPKQSKMCNTLSLSISEQGCSDSMGHTICIPIWAYQYAPTKNRNMGLKYKQLVFRFFSPIP
jgi:hypothetical protein